MDVVWGEAAGVKGQLWVLYPLLFILQVTIVSSQAMYFGVTRQIAELMPSKVVFECICLSFVVAACPHVQGFQFFIGILLLKTAILEDESEWQVNQTSPFRASFLIRL